MHDAITTVLAALAILGGLSHEHDPWSGHRGGRSLPDA